MDISEASIFCTGGAGTLGNAIAKRRRNEGWTGKFTVYSTDTHKHEKMRREFPDIRFVQGDIRDPVTLYNAMVGHDIVIHCAAVKVIPVSEYQSIDTYQVNVQGSLNVCEAAQRAGVGHVVGISTDKACHPTNAYGATKYLMEKVFQEFSRTESKTEYHLVRYGNVLESNGSVIEAWKRAVERGEPIKITDAKMTRFWISPAQAAEYVETALRQISGAIYIPKMHSLSIGKLSYYVVGKEAAKELIPIRPGEKRHECILTEEESWHAYQNKIEIILFPTTETRREIFKRVCENLCVGAYTSDLAPEMTHEELQELLDG